MAVVANAKLLANLLVRQAAVSLTKHAKTTKENNLSIAKLGLPRKYLAVQFLLLILKEEIWYINSNLMN